VIDIVGLSCLLAVAERAGMLCNWQAAWVKGVSGRHGLADDRTGAYALTKYLHTMIRVSALDDTIAFFAVLGLREIRRRVDEKGRYTNVFLAAPGDEEAPLELTYNWDPEPYTGGRNFGHLAYAVDNIYDTCRAFMAHGVTINRPPRDGRMAFIRTPDGISIELLQAGAALPAAEPWSSMANTGSW